MGEVDTVSTTLGKWAFAAILTIAMLLMSWAGEEEGRNKERREWVAGHRRIVDGKVEFWHGPEWRKEP